MQSSGLKLTAPIPLLSHPPGKPIRAMETGLSMPSCRRAAAWAGIMPVTPGATTVLSSRAKPEWMAVSRPLPPSIRSCPSFSSVAKRK